MSSTPASPELVVDLTLGGVETRWLHLPLRNGRTDWSLVLDPSEPLILQELYASSESGELSHPGELPLASVLTLPQLLSLIDEELGADAQVEDVQLLVTREPRLTFRSHAERSIRLESASLRSLSDRLAKMTDVGVDRWLTILEAVVYEALTETHLRIRIAGETTTMHAYDSEAKRDLDEPNETVDVP